jgi:FdhE protein
MTEPAALAPVEVEKLVEVLKELRPAYKILLEFYGKVFSAQEDSRGQIKIEPIHIPENILSAKLKGELPLIHMTEFVIDKETSGRLFKTICTIALSANETMAVSAQNVLKAMDKRRIDSSRLFDHLLAENDAYFEEIAGEFEIEQKVLVSLVYSSIKPSIAFCAYQLSSYLDPNHVWGKGYCPICGNLPGLAALEKEGARFMFCSFCWHKWQVQRVFCPFCENEDPQTLQYFYSEEEQDYRVDTCNQCNKYIKTVDTRKINRSLYPPLEQVATLHLDMKAEEMGFKSPVTSD